MAETENHTRLPRNFHKTFKPERQYLSAMLKYAASGQEGDYQDIAAATGIPTGVSTGKVPAILDYCRAMGLLQLAGADRSSVRKPALTPFGRIVLLEDPYLKSNVTQWIAHLNLCSPLTGADVWYHTFCRGLSLLGMSFARSKLESHLSLVYSTEKSGLIGPLIGMYEDSASFRECGALAEDTATVTRRPAPVTDELARGYGAWILQLISDYFAGDAQVSVTDLEVTAGWRSIPGWDVAAVQRVLDLVQRKGVLEVDRHMEPWLLRPRMPAISAWGHIYDDLL